VPRAHARSEQLFAKLIVQNAANPDNTTDLWNWQGLSLFYNPMGPRGVRSK